MKIEKLTENKIRIIVKTDELINNNINLDSFMINNITSQKFFLDILDRAEKEIGFCTKDCKLLIEAFFSLDDVLVFTITKFAIRKKGNYKLRSAKSIKFTRTPIYEFSSFEEYCELCKALYKSDIPLSGISKKISLYLYKDTYYLVIDNLNLTYKNFRKLFSVLSEFSHIVKSPEKLEPKILEYGRLIIRQNAIKTGIKYFV